VRTCIADGLCINVGGAGGVGGMDICTAIPLFETDPHDINYGGTFNQISEVVVGGVGASASVQGVVCYRNYSCDSLCIAHPETGAPACTRSTFSFPFYAFSWTLQAPNCVGMPPLPNPNP